MVMKLVFLFFLFFQVFNLLSQEILIIDSVTNIPIPYVAIKFGENGFYSNSNGKFNLDSIIEMKFSASHLSYNSKSLLKINIADTIKLSPKSHTLNEVYINNKEITNNIIINIPRKARNYGSVPLTPKEIITTVITPKSQFVDYNVDEISIRFEKISEIDFPKDTYAIFRVVINKLDQGNVFKQLFSSDIIAFDNRKSEILNIDINNDVRFEENGLAITVEFIGYKKDNNLIEVKNVFLRPSLTARTNDYFSSETYISNFQFDNLTYKNLNDLLSAMKPNNKIVRSLAIGLKISN